MAYLTPQTPGHLRTLLLAAALGLTPPRVRSFARAPTGGGRLPVPHGIHFIGTPGHPFEPIFTRDGRALFISLLDSHALAVLAQGPDGFRLDHVVAFPGSPAGMVMTHDGRILIAADGAHSAVDFLDVERLISGGRALLRVMGAGRFLGANQVNVDPSDRFLFVSDERGAAISVVNLAFARAHSFADASIVGLIPSGPRPVALAISGDGRYLFATSEVAPNRLRWPKRCHSEAGGTSRRAEGTVFVVSIPTAARAPARSVISTTPAHCAPVRLVLSRDENTAFVTARESGQVLAFDTHKLIAGAAGALVAQAPAGPAPVGLALFGNPARILIAASDRFGADRRDPQRLWVLDAQWGHWRPSLAPAKWITSGAFPRELRVSPDGSTIAITNYYSNQVEIVDVLSLPR